MWQLATRKVTTDQVLVMGRGMGYVQKQHSNMFLWIPASGDNVEFVSNIGTPCLGGAIVLTNGVPTYMDEQTFNATYTH